MGNESSSFASDSSSMSTYLENWDDVGVDVNTLHVGKPFTRAFNFKRLSRTVRDGKFLASFVPTGRIMLLGFF